MSYRPGNFSASEVWKLLTDPQKKSEKWSKTSMTYIRQKAAETLTGIEHDITSASTSYGIEMEPEAKAFYESVFGVRIQEAKSILKDGLSGTADGLLSPLVTEFKCPFNQQNHFDNILMDLETFKKERKEYYYQDQSYLYLYDMELLHHVSYSPIFPGANKLAVLSIPRDEKVIKSILERVALAVKEKENLLAKLK